MVIDDVGEVIGGVAVRFEEDKVLQVGILKNHLSPEQIVDACLTLERHPKTDDRGHPGSEIGLHLSGREVATEAVVARSLLASDLFLSHLLQPLGRAEATIGVAGGKQLLGVLLIEGGPFALAIGTHWPPHVWPLIPLETKPAQDIENSRFRAFDVSVAIGVLDAEQKCAGLPLAPRLSLDEEPVEEGSAPAANVQGSGRARREADAKSL
jgi:hypothetical protein